LLSVLCFLASYFEIFDFTVLYIDAQPTYGAPLVAVRTWL